MSKKEKRFLKLDILESSVKDAGKTSQIRESNIHAVNLNKRTLTKTIIRLKLTDIIYFPPPANSLCHTISCGTSKFFQFGIVWTTTAWLSLFSERMTAQWQWMDVFFSPFFCWISFKQTCEGLCVSLSVFWRFETSSSEPPELIITLTSIKL